MGGDDARREFVRAMSDAGVSPVDGNEIDTDGSLTRFRVEGDKHGAKNGWCVLHVDSHGAAGAFGSWKSGISGT
ncbi:MAG: hypothetical protein ACREPL_09330 [Rhodanobacteraceae bacterium]